jgi:hypothetical protein
MMKEPWGKNEAAAGGAGGGTDMEVLSVNRL